MMTLSAITQVEACDMSSSNMNPKIQELILQVGTDISGKWLSLEQAHQLALLAATSADLVLADEPSPRLTLIPQRS
jgi:hypothetical protein